MLDLYAELGLSRRATGDEIKAAYRGLAKRYHPDVNAGDEQDEWRTKEINRAYAILGDPEARAAYDLELARQRAAARRGFWLSAATGAATFIVTVSSVWVMAVWRQNASIQQSQTSEPAVLVGNENPVKNRPAEAVANRGLAPSETVVASVPGLFGEPRSSIMPNTTRGYRQTQAVAPSQPIAEPPLPKKIVSAPPSAPAQLPHGHEQEREAYAPAENTAPPAELALPASADQQDLLQLAAVHVVVRGVVAVDRDVIVGRDADEALHQELPGLPGMLLGPVGLEGLLGQVGLVGLLGRSHDQGGRRVGRGRSAAREAEEQEEAGVRHGAPS